MGCDIHMHLEYRKEDNNKNKSDWINGNLYKFNEWSLSYPDDPSEKEFSKVRMKSEDRNYELFSILADVRNSSDINPISQPRGIPDDSNKYIKEDFEDWGCDQHSASYFSLKELIDAAKDYKEIPMSGVISPEQQKLLDEKGIIPSSWCRGTNEEGYEHREWVMEDQSLNKLIQEIKKHYVRLFHWGHKSKNEDFTKYQEDIRIVFWFDN